MNDRRKHDDSRGFTLVELLVVIGIVAVLLAILLPTLSRVRQAGNAVTCAANLRQIGQAVLLYVQDNRGFLPPSEPLLGEQLPFGRWPSILVGAGYLNVGTADQFGVTGPASVFKCPSDATISADRAVNVNFEGTSFIPNGLLMPRSIYYNPHRGPQSIWRFSYLDRRLLMTEKDGNLQYGGPIGLSPAGAPSYQRLINNVRPRHGRGDRNGGLANVLFADGHVTPMTYAEIIRPAQQALAGASDPDPQRLWGRDADR